MNNNLILLEYFYLEDTVENIKIFILYNFLNLI